MTDVSINKIGDVTGQNIRITQVYAPGSGTLEPEAFTKANDIAPFSPQWLIFTQQSVPLIGRSEERGALRQFLESIQPFAWWTIVGASGTGKSRFLLDEISSLPDGWRGGFLSREKLSVALAASWEAAANTLWIIDDAAAIGNDLARILGMWATQYQDGAFKVRVLLVERGYSETAGWWADITQGLSPQSLVINQTLYARPLTLLPLAKLYSEFLLALERGLEAPMQARLREKLGAMGEERILEQSLGGTPLLLMLLAAELLNEDAALEGLNGATLVERHFAREIDILRARCETAGLRFTVLLDLLFITSSCHPLSILIDTDFLVVHLDKAMLLHKTEDGLYEIPNVSQLRDMGVPIDLQNQRLFENLNRILEIDDVAHYFSILEEIGLSDRRYSIQPDLIAATLFNLAFNSPDTPSRLKQRRGEFSAAKLQRLVVGAIQLDAGAAYSAWARLDDRTLSALIGYMRFAGSTIRFPMLMVRELNLRRSNRVPIHNSRLFDANHVHLNAVDVGRYFWRLRQTIGTSVLETGELQGLAAGPYAWAAPFVAELTELSQLEAIQLGRVVCAISDTTVLDRTTNLSSFLRCLQTGLSKAAARQRDAISGKGPRLSDVEEHALDGLVDAVLEFGISKAWPHILKANEPEFGGPYRAVANVMVTASYVVGNQLRGREESEESRQRALVGLDIARLALDVAPQADILHFVDRNSALLLSQRATIPEEVASVYRDILSRMAQYAGAEPYTDAITDLLLRQRHQPSPEVLQTVLTALEEAPHELVIAERIAWEVSDAMSELAGRVQSEDSVDLCRLASRFFSYFFGRMRLADDDDALIAVGNLARIAANLASRAEQQHEIAKVFVEAYASFDASPPSEVFLAAFITTAQSVQMLFQGRQAAAAALMPIDTQFLIIPRDQLLPFVRDADEREQLQPLDHIQIATSSHMLGGRSHSFVSFNIIIARSPDFGGADALSSLARELYERMREKARPGVTSETSPPD